ncbi:hypothetical protein J2X05_001030 [Cellvibrio fibrivorans]|uniref:Uncharacterized protein n=1 Tax=Cellvibrio fibrivorans TaxID=126350 RepID=A0ABU1UUZ9_9GAMM|nr:hypothetical protein [Cellvibrio fibrivorans]
MAIQMDLFMQKNLPHFSDKDLHCVDLEQPAHI